MSAALQLIAGLLAGFSVARLCLGRQAAGLKLVMSVLLGLGFSGAVFATAMVLRRPMSIAIGALFALGLGAAFLTAAEPRRIEWRVEYPPRLQLVLRLLCALAAISFCLFLIEHHLRYPEGGWDGWAIWNARARFFFRGGNAAAFWHGNVHADYPFLVPALVAQGFVLLGRESFAIPGLIGALFALLTAALLSFAVARQRGLTSGLVTGAVLLTTPAFFTYAWAQYADEAASAFLLAAWIAAAMALEESGRARVRLLALAGLALSLGAWCKNEGALWSCAFALALVVPRADGAPPGRRLRDLSLALLGAAPLLALLIVYKTTLAPANDLVAGQGAQSLQRLAEPDRYLLIATQAFKTLFTFKEWGLAMMAVPPALIAGWRRRPHAAPVRALSVALASSLLAMGAIYLLTPREVRWHLSTSSDRLLLQLWPTALFLLALCLAPGSRVETQQHPEAK